MDDLNSDKVNDGSVDHPLSNYSILSSGIEILIPGKLSFSFGCIDMNKWKPSEENGSKISLSLFISPPLKLPANLLEITVANFGNVKSGRSDK